MARKGLLWVISGPSGAGKSTIRERLITKFNFVYSISCTTRPPRGDEVNGIDYVFIKTDLFEQRVAAGEFLEWALVFEHYYGTPKAPLLAHIDAGEDVLLEIDVQGAEQIRKNIRDLDIDAHFLFIKPPSLNVLRERLIRRGTEDSEDIKRRLEETESEIAHADRFDLVVINDNLVRALVEISDYINDIRANRA